MDEAESGRVADRPQFRKMLEEASRPNATFQGILVWKFSRFRVKREHAVAFKSMLRRRGIKVVSITEHADDSPTGKLMEAIIESVDEFYSENLAQEVARGMREAASRGFWMTTYSPYGYCKVMVQDGAKKRPKLEPEPAHSCRGGAHVPDGGCRQEHPRHRQDPQRRGHCQLQGEALVQDRGPSHTHQRDLHGDIGVGPAGQGQGSSGEGGERLPRHRVQGPVPQGGQAAAFSCPVPVPPRRVSGSYLLSGLVKCKGCGRALSGQESKSGQFSYYVCKSLIKRGSGACEAPRLNAKRFEALIVSQLRECILTEKNIRDLVGLVDEEMDGVARERRLKLEALEGELAEVKRWLDRLYRAIETTDLNLADISPRIKEHRERQAKLEMAAEEARLQLAERRVTLDDVDTITEYAKGMSEFLKSSELTESRAFISSFVKEIVVSPGKAAIRYTIPMPDDSRIPGLDTDEMALQGPVLSTVSLGGLEFIEDRSIFEMKMGR